MVQWVKLPLIMPTSHIGVLVRVPIAPIQPPANASGREQVIVQLLGPLPSK